MGKHRPWRGVMKRWILCLLALFMLQTAVVPAPARAGAYVTFVVGVSEFTTTIWSWGKLAVEWASNLKIVKALIDVLVAMSDLFKILFENSEKRLGFDTRAMLYGDMVAAKVEEKMAQARVDAGALDTFLGVSVGAAMQGAVPKNHYLCKKLLALQAGATTQDFEKEVSRMAAEAISNRYRCPTCDGRGPDYRGKESARRCDQGYGNVLIDGAKTTCEKKLDESGGSLADADIAPIDGRQIYEMPLMSQYTYENNAFLFEEATVYVPTPDSDRQRLWVAAWDNIFLLAGPRPTPLHGKAMNTPVGKVQRSLFNHCVASQNALVKQCTDLLAYYTRPNCNQIQAATLPPWAYVQETDLCKDQQQKCLAAKGIIDLEPFDKCEKGLSPYEEDKIDQLLCKSNQHYVDMVHAGATYEKLTASSDFCEMAWSRWRVSVDKKHANCTAAVNGMQTLDSCWAAVDAVGGGHAALEDGRSGVSSDVVRTSKVARADKFYKAKWQGGRDQKETRAVGAAESDLSPQTVNP